MIFTLFAATASRNRTRPGQNYLYLLFEFNIYSSLLLPFVLQGVVFAVLLIFRGRKNQRVADGLLAILLLLYTLRVCQWMLGFAGWYDVRDWHTTFMFYLPFSHWLAIGPLIYFYFLSVTNAGFRFRKRDWLHFIPEFIWLLRALFIFGADVVLNHWISGDPLPYFDHTHGYYHENGIGFPGYLWDIMEYVSVFTYLFLTLRLFRKYRSYLANEFSNTEQIDFRWLRNFILANLIGHLVWLLFDLADMITGKPLTYIQDWYSFFFLGVLVYYLSISGYASRPTGRQESELHFDPLEEEEEGELQTTEASPEMQALEQQLVTLMQNEKPYLDPGINLARLSSALNTSPALLSRTINATQGKNFNDYINMHRVSAVQEKLRSGSTGHLSLLGIALDCGFNSKATFNRAFKKHAGISPSAYLKSIGRDQENID